MRPVMMRTAEVGSADDLPRAFASIALDGPRPVLVLLGGAASMPDETAGRLVPLFREVAKVAEGLGAAVVDGGTDAGVMRLIGRARTAGTATFPLIGVVASGTVDVPGTSTTGKAVVEVGHSHVIVVPGSSWGDESPWLFRVADQVAAGRPVLTLVVEGGPIALTEAGLAAQHGGRILVVAGSGRTADAIARAARGGEASGDIAPLVESGLIVVVDLDRPDEIAARIREFLGGETMDEHPTPGANTARARPIAREAAGSGSSHRSLRDVFESSDIAAGLGPLETDFLRARWLDQIDWMARRAAGAKRRYQLLRMTTVIGGVIVPALISISLGQPSTETWLRWLTFVVSLVVAISAGIEEFLRYGEQWRHYRRTAERLKVEGWQFITRTGPYVHGAPEDAFQTFATQVEQLLGSDVSDYLDRVVVVSAPSGRHEVFTEIRR
jgi:hypothetical protein